MSENAKKQLNYYVKHILFKNKTGIKLDQKEKSILVKYEKMNKLKKINSENVDIKYMIFKLKYELAIMIIEKYNLEQKNPIERLEEKRLKNIA